MANSMRIVLFIECKRMNALMQVPSLGARSKVIMMKKVAEITVLALKKLMEYGIMVYPH